MKRKLIYSSILSLSAIIFFPSSHAISEDNLIGAGLAAFSVSNLVAEFDVSNEFTNMAALGKQSRDHNAGLDDKCDRAILAGMGNPEKVVYGLLYHDTIGTGVLNNVSRNYVQPTYIGPQYIQVAVDDDSDGVQDVDGSGNPIFRSESAGVEGVDWGNQGTYGVDWGYMNSDVNGVDYGDVFTAGQCDSVMPPATLTHIANGGGSLKKNKVSELIRSQYATQMNRYNGGYLMFVRLRDDIKAKGLANKLIVFSPLSTDFNSWEVYGCFDEYDSSTITRNLKVIGSIVGGGKKGKSRCGSNYTGYGKSASQGGSLWGSHIMTKTINGKAKLLHFPGPIAAGIDAFVCPLLDNTGGDMHYDFPISTADNSTRPTCASLTDFTDPEA